MESESQASISKSVEEMAVGRSRDGGPVPTAYEDEKALKVSVLQTNQEFDQLKEEWNQLLNKSNSTVFQTFEWQRMWWEIFGGNNKLHILTFRFDGELVGIAPFMLKEEQLLGVYTYRELQFLASYISSGSKEGSFSHYSLSDYLDLIVDPAYQEETAEALTKYFLNNRDFLDSIILDELPEGGVIMQSVLPRLEASSLTFEKEGREVCPRIELPGTMDDYLYMISSSARYKLRRSMRSVSEDKEYEVNDIRSDEEFNPAFESLVELHQDRWNKQGYPGIFADERVKEFLARVSKVFLRQDRLRMKGAYDHEGNCIAVDLTFAFKKQVFDYQRAFDVTSPLAKHRPGFALTYFLVQDAIEEGRNIFDLLRGGERYKKRLASSAPQNWRISIDNTTRKEGVRYRLFQFSDVISRIRFRLSRELLLLRIHVREWGVSKFMPKYIDFLKSRFKGRHEE